MSTLCIYHSADLDGHCSGAINNPGAAPNPEEGTGKEMSKIIMLSGKAGVGKSTLASHIAGLYPGTVRMAFADAVREEVAELLGIPIEQVRLPSFKSEVFQIGGRFMPGRQILQWWGTDIRRAADPEYWSRRLREKIAAVEAPLVVVDDCRFPDELMTGFSMGALCVRVSPYPDWTPIAPDHPSETALDDTPLSDWSMLVAPEFGDLERWAKLLLARVGLYKLPTRGTW